MARRKKTRQRIAGNWTPIVRSAFKPSTLMSRRLQPVLRPEGSAPKPKGQESLAEGYAFTALRAAKRRVESLELRLYDWPCATWRSISLKRPALT
jgi:hypothetical protein